MTTPADKPVPARTVKPRKPTQNQSLILFDTECGIWVERTGEFFEFSYEKLGELVCTEPSSIFGGEESVMVVDRLVERFKDVPNFNAKVVKVPQTRKGNPKKKPTEFKAHAYSYFGFKRQGKKDLAQSRYFNVFDPNLFVSSMSFMDLTGYPKGERFRTFIAYAVDLRNWCDENGLRLSLTAGGIGSQLMKDARFFPNARRKVPKATNEKARQALPGNHYSRHNINDVEGMVTFDAVVCYDQKAAHHSAAKLLEFPHSDSLNAHGNFRDLENPKPWLRNGTSHFKRVLQSHKGLFYGRIYSPGFRDTEFTLPFLKDRGYVDTYFFSNQVTYIQSFKGVRIEYLYASWTSEITDPGLNKYAEWSLDKLDTCDPGLKPTLKTIMLSAYGMLAATPRHMEFGWVRAKKGEPQSWITYGPQRRTFQVTKTKREIELTICNGIWRGMIEAETTLESLRFAEYLTGKGHTVVQIYADAVYARFDPELDPPILYEPWKDGERLDDYVSPNATQFASRQKIRAPGIPKERQAIWRNRMVGV